MSFEGSSEIDTGGPVPTSTTTTTDEEVEVRDDEQTQDDGAGDTTDTQDEGGEAEKGGLTEKGTKLDDNPLSAAHQQLANERRKVERYERVLSSPELLRKFAKESGMTLAEAKEELQEEVEELYTPDKIKTSEDVAKALNSMQGSFKKELKALQEENERLKGGFKGLGESQRLERVVSTLATDVASTREQYPILNPKSSEYNEKLANEVSEMFAEMDLDPNTQELRGQHSYAKVAERFMRAAGIARKQGSREAQTIVKTRTAGKVVTSTKGGSQESAESSNPGTAIAQRIAKTLGTMK